MNKHLRSILLVLSVVLAGTAGAFAIERVALAQAAGSGVVDAGGNDVAPRGASPAGSGSAAVVPAAASPIDPQAPGAPHVTSTDPAIDPVSELGLLVQFARTGEGRLALGAGLVLFVWALRALLKPRIAWFGTPAGGYLLGFGSAAIFYVGGAMLGGVAVTFNLACDAVVAAFAASGKWEALRDVLAKMGRLPPTFKAAGASLVVAITGVALVVTAVGGCKTASGVAGAGGHALIDCGKADPAILADALSDLASLLAGQSPDWNAIEQQAELHGEKIGGCAIAELVQRYLAPEPGRSAPAPESGRAASAALERFRASVAHGATFRVGGSDL
jgi:hypothetical protein